MTGIWLDTFKGIIPAENYSVSLVNGEEKGLTVTLTGSMHKVTIDFGIAASVQMLDEGVLLQGADTPQLQSLREFSFPSTIYEIENGDLGCWLRAYMGDALYTAHNYRQYNIVTLNYVIRVVTRWAPEISIHPIQSKTPR